MAINVTAVENALYDFVYSASGNKTTVWAFQNMPQQDDPRANAYCELSIGNLARIGVDFQDRPDPTTLQNKITGNREFVLTVNVRGPNALGIAEDIRTALQKFDVLETLRAAGIVYVNDMPIQNLTGLEATEFVPRHMLEIVFRIASVPTAAAGAIEHVEGTGEYYKNGTKVLEEDLEINPIP